MATYIIQQLLGEDPSIGGVSSANHQLELHRDIKTSLKVSVAARTQHNDGMKTHWCTKAEYAPMQLSIRGVPFAEAMKEWAWHERNTKGRGTQREPRYPVPGVPFEEQSSGVSVETVLQTYKPISDQASLQGSMHMLTDGATTGQQCLSNLGLAPLNEWQKLNGFTPSSTLQDFNAETSGPSFLSLLDASHRMDGTPCLADLQVNSDSVPIEDAGPASVQISVQGSLADANIDATQFARTGM